MNAITVYGRVCSDVTTRDVNGRTVANFRIASQTRRKVGDEYVTNFYHVAAWGNLAGTASKFLKKGNRTCVSGELVVRSYVGTDGQNHQSIEIDANAIDLVETKAESEVKSGATVAASPATQTAAPVYTSPALQNFTPVELDDSLPF